MSTQISESLKGACYMLSGVWEGSQHDKLIIRFQTLFEVATTSDKWK